MSERDPAQHFDVLIRTYTGPDGQPWQEWDRFFRDYSGITYHKPVAAATPEPA